MLESPARKLKKLLAISISSVSLTACAPQIADTYCSRTTVPPLSNEMVDEFAKSERTWRPLTDWLYVFLKVRKETC